MATTMNVTTKSPFEFCDTNSSKYIKLLMYFENKSFNLGIWSLITFDVSVLFSLKELKNAFIQSPTELSLTSVDA